MRDRPAVLGPVKPLRFAPSLTANGPDRTCGLPKTWQVRDGRDDVLSPDAEINFTQGAAAL
jgi:hypothetical protein